MTGWTWEQVRDQLDLPRVEALRRAWRDNPPLPVASRLAAEAMGVEFASGNLTGKAKGGDRPEAPAMADPLALMAELGQAEPVRYVAPARGLATGEAPTKRRSRKTRG